MQVSLHSKQKEPVRGRSWKSRGRQRQQRRAAATEEGLRREELDKNAEKEGLEVNFESGASGAADGRMGK